MSTNSDNMVFSELIWVLTSNDLKSKSTNIAHRTYASYFDHETPKVRGLSVTRDIGDGDDNNCYVMMTRILVMVTMTMMIAMMMAARMMNDDHDDNNGYDDGGKADGSEIKTKTIIIVHVLSKCTFCVWIYFDIFEETLKQMHVYCM